MRTNVTVLIPAHDEQDGISKTLDSLAHQTLRPERIIVGADNCTDDTAAVARLWGAEAIVTVDNADKKAGALNQALPQALERMPDDGKLLVMDADSTLNEEFLRNALSTFERDERIGAVSSTFYGEPGGGFVGLMQRMEFEQYAFEVRRRRDTLVLSGTATVFRAGVLGAIAERRGSALPGRKGAIYYTKSITEDNELTLAIKKLGWRTVQPQGCEVLTEVMPSWRMLMKQRLRWKRGTLEDIKLYGAGRLTLPYLAQQVELAVSVFARALILVMATTMIGAGVQWYPLWSLIGLVFVVIPVISVRRMGWKPMLVAGSVLPQLGYRVFQEYVLLVAYYQIYLQLEAKWHHLASDEGKGNVRKWWRSRRGGNQRRDTGLHGSERRLGSGGGVHPAVRGPGPVAHDQAGQAPVGPEPTHILPAVGTLPTRSRTGSG